MLIIIAGWLGLRHLITIVIGQSQEGPLKSGQRICHFIEFLIYVGGIFFAFKLDSWLPLLAALLIANLFHRFVIWTGKEFPINENDKETE
jgi:hypothetical protein